MFQRFSVILICFFYLHPLSAQINNRVEGQVMIQLFRGCDITTTIKKINEQQGFSPQVIQPISKRMNIWLLQFDPGKIAGEQFIDILSHQPEVANVQFNHTIQYRTTPDDNLFSTQWNMLNDGTDGGIPDADIDADQAWDIATGGLTVQGDTIVIAVVDDGFDLNHEDLSFFKNYNEIPLNSIDDDGNGYVDDFKGWNSTDNNDDIPSKNHGTHVSGIAGAKGNNGTGVAGVNWNVKILPVKCDVFESEVIASYAYIYAMRELYNNSNGEKGAFVVSTNSSFGIDFVSADDYPLWCAMYDSLGTLGILSAAATNNTMANIDVVGDMPTGCTSDFLISVTNTDRADNLKAAYGAVSVDLGAPGYLIESTFPGDAYGVQTGTSMASPHLAGTVALLYAAACDKFLDDYDSDPETMSLMLKDYILNGVDFVEDLNGICVSNGRLNLNNSLLNLLNGYCSTAVDGNGPTLYPNPANEVLHFKNIGEINENLQIEIYNETAQLVKSEILEGLAGVSDGISVLHFKNGIYFLKIADINSKTIYSSAFVVQH